MRRVLYIIKKDYHYITHTMFVQLFYMYAPMYIVKPYIGRYGMSVLEI